MGLLDRSVTYVGAWNTFLLGQTDGLLVLPAQPLANVCSSCQFRCQEDNMGRCRTQDGTVNSPGALDSTAPSHCARLGGAHAGPDAGHLPCEGSERDSRGVPHSVREDSSKDLQDLA